MAMGAEEVGLVAIPFAGSPSVDTSSPITVFLSMALSTEAVGLFEGHRHAAGQVELVPVVRVMTIQTPTVVLVMPQDDVGVENGKLPPLGVGGHEPVTVRAGVDSWGKRRWRHLHSLTWCFHRSRSNSLSSGAGLLGWTRAPECTRGKEKGEVKR